MKVLAIALNTFREAVRNKILYALLVSAIGFIAFGLVLGRLSLEQNARVIQDLGVFGISLFGVVIGIFVGVNLLYDEIQRRTIYVLLSKPLERWQFVLGKYVGMLLTLLAQVVLMSLALLVVLWLEAVPIRGVLFQAIGLAYVELMLVTAVAVLFSSFSTPYLSGFLTFGVFVLGRLMDDLMQLLPKLDIEPLKVFSWWISRIFPDLSRLDISAHLAYGEAASAATVGWAAAYGLSYTAILLLGAVLLFGRRDFL